MTRSTWLRTPQARSLARRRRCNYHCNLPDMGFPFSAVLTVLLFIMMINVPPITHSVLLLPAAWQSTRQPNALREDAMHLQITRDGAIYFNSTRVSAPEEDDLRHQIRKRIFSGAEKKIYLKADARAHYGDVSVAIDAARHAGVNSATILTESKASQ